MAAPDLLADILAISHLLPSDHSEFESSEKPSSPDPHETTVARWRARVAARPSLSDSSLPYSSISIPFTEIAATSIIPALSTEFTATPHVLSTTLVHFTPTPVTSTIPSQTSSVGSSRKRRSVEDGIEAAAKAKSEADGEIGSKADVGIDVEDETYIEDYHTNIRTDIGEDAETHAHVGVEAKIEAEAEESDRDTIEIGVDVVHLEPNTLVVFPVSTIVVRLVEHEKAIQEVAEVEKNTLCATVRSLEAIEMRLHGIVRDEREARARIERHLGLVQEELR
ncbi:hypothetical protein Tco_0923404 [Tanacetum coccineum]|uniref:Uncharacterized protein n=1 Tax=Tanacetum coccineum TaxID=301880 RepID=A0ABQ5D0V9_9ASTR